MTKQRLVEARSLAAVGPVIIVSIDVINRLTINSNATPRPYSLDLSMIHARIHIYELEYRSLEAGTPCIPAGGLDRLNRVRHQDLTPP